jgi:hypothetical protein
VKSELLITCFIKSNNQWVFGSYISLY